MKTLPKILKGDIPLTVDLYMSFTGKLIDPDEAAKVNKMLVSVFNAGKGGVYSKEIKENFDEFYKLYPLKKSKKLALKAYIGALKEVSHEIIMEALRAQLPEIMTVYNTDPSKVKHPSSWLSAGSYDDEVKGKPSVNSDIMTDEEIFNTKWGQYALKEGLGYPVRLFCIKNGRKPTKEEYKVIQGTEYGGFIQAESRKLEHYLKDEL